MIAWTLCTLLVLAGIAREDLRSRSVHIAYFVVLAGLLIGRWAMSGAGAGAWLWEGLWNLGMVLLLLALLFAYVRIRHAGRLRFSDSMGAGDVVLFVLLAFGFSSDGFLPFLVFSLLFAVVAHLLVRRLLRLQEASVATAAWVSICFGVHLLVELLSSGPSLG